MTEKPTCSCGQNETKRMILPCAGQANTGQLTNLAAIQLVEEGYGKMVCTALLATGNEGLVKSARNAEEVVILDGCPLVCASKIAECQGVKAGQHIVVTELGITKGPSRSYTDDDIETIVAACWKGEGRTDEPKKRGHVCTCGCGGSCE
jgi:uncharacterized metal-binding protein